LTEDPEDDFDDAAAAAVQQEFVSFMYFRILFLLLSFDFTVNRDK